MRGFVLDMQFILADISKMLSELRSPDPLAGISFLPFAGFLWKQPLI